MDSGSNSATGSGASGLEGSGAANNNAATTSVSGPSKPSPLRRQPSALAFWQSQTSDSNRSSQPSSPLHPARKISMDRRKVSAGGSDADVSVVSSIASSFSPQRNTSPKPEPGQGSPASTKAPPMASSSSTWPSSRDHDAAKSKRRKKKLVQMKRRHDLKAANRASASPNSTTTVPVGSPSHLDLSETWSSESDEESLGDLASDEEREISYSGIDLDERLGIGSSSSRRASAHKATRSLQSSPPISKRSSTAMLVSVSQDTGLKKRGDRQLLESRDLDSSESESYYDVDDEENQDRPAAPISPSKQQAEHIQAQYASQSPHSSSSDSLSSSQDESYDDSGPRSASGQHLTSDESDSRSWLKIRNAASGTSSSTTLRQEHMRLAADPSQASAKASRISHRTSQGHESSGGTTPDPAKESDTAPGTESSLHSTSSSSVLPLSPLSPSSPSDGAFPASFLPSPPPLSSRTFASQQASRPAAIPPPRPLPNGPLPPLPQIKSSNQQTLPIITQPSESSQGPIGAENRANRSSDLSPLDSKGLPSRPQSGATARASSDGEPTTGPAFSEVGLGPSGTIRGRPRGATIGAVPSSSVNNRPTSFLGRIASQQSPRPRSLLSHELVLPSTDSQSSNTSARSNWTTLSASNVPAASSHAASSGSRRNSFDASQGNPIYPTRVSSLDEQSAAKHSGNNGGGSAAVSSATTEGSGNITPASSSSMISAPLTTSSSAGRSRSGSTASLLQQVQQQPLRSHASFVIAVVGHHGAGKSTVIKKGLRQFGLSKPQVLSEKVVSHSTLCIVDSEQQTIEVLEIDTSILLSGSSKRFTWPKFLPRIDAVILCYDASRISSFRGMSELLENFSVQDTRTVMLACKSEISPKQVDPYYASDMAGIYNVGLAECSDQSDEGKKRMRDCFSYLVKEVAKARAGRTRKVPGASSAGLSAFSPSPSSAPPAASSSSEWHSNTSGSSSAPLARKASHSSQVSEAVSSDSRNRAGSHGSMASSTGWDHASVSQRSTSDRGPNDLHLPHHHQQHGGNGAAGPGSSTTRKVSDANTSEGNSFVGEDSENDVAAVQQSISKAKLGLQSAKSVGGYVTIEELWDKLFFAAVSGNDSAFVHMFMVFYRGFVRPIELLKQLVGRFDKLADGETSDGVMIRFSLIRLATMLNDWMQDYPGDLSGSETYPLLCDFLDRLCSHPATMHVAAQIAPMLDKVTSAPDLDAAWSKDQDTSRPKSVAADVPPVRPTLPTTASDSTAQNLQGIEQGGRGRSHSDASSSGVYSVHSLPSDGGSSNFGSKVSPGARGMDTRARSGSDLTSSSREGGHDNSSGGGSLGNSASETSQNDSFGSTVALDAHQQKLILRAVSNQLAVLDDTVIAGELTHLEWQLFLTIRPRDLLRHILVPREVRGKGGPVARCIAHFNYISFWVCSMILVQSKTKHRARMLEKFMNIAAILRHDNNYNTLQAVLAGLGNAAVHRLKYTREVLVGKPVNKAYQSLARLMGSDRSFAAYRLALENSDGRTIPYLGVHLQDILSISDGNPSKRASDDMVHWRKFCLMDEAVRAIVKCQDWNQRTRGKASVGKLIMDLPVMDEDVLYSRSLHAEPRVPQSAASSTGSKILNILKPAPHN